MIRHVNPTRAERISKAPYNFIPLPEKVFLAPTLKRPDGTEIKPWEHHDQYLPGTYTGWIDLTITAETPLYVRCGPKVEHIRNEDPGDGHADLTRKHCHRQDFFHHGNPDQPVLPGSSIRGMIRSLVEILGYGKIQHTKSRRLYFRSLGVDSMANLYRKRFATNAQIGRRGGIFQRAEEGGTIQPCEIARVLSGEIEKLGQGTGLIGNGANSLPNWELQHRRVLVQVKEGKREKLVTSIRLATDQDVQPNEQEKAGILVITGWMKTKKREFVFFPMESESLVVSSEVLNDFEDDDQLSSWQQDAFSKNMPKNDCRKRDGLLRDGEPVFYLQGRGQEALALGRAGMFRLPYQYRTEDMIPSELRHPEDIDLSTVIFGTIEKKNVQRQFEGRIIKGRVFFEDARWNRQGGNPFLEPGDKGLCSPKILSTPKPTAFQHYLVQADPDDPDKLLHYDSPPGTTQIRGYKRYWHKQAANPFELKLQPDSTQHTIIRPVKKSTAFTGRVRFENLTDVELGALLTALQLPGGKRHQIGMGKPLGMGSVKITATLHLTERTGEQNRYARLFADDGSLHLGELPPQRNHEVEGRAKETFCKAIVQHHNSSAASPISVDTDLWAIPRLSVLALMLESNDPRTQGKTDYEPLGDSWKERRVLPTPQGVVGIGDPDWGGPLPPPPLPESKDRIRCRLLERKPGTKGWKILWIDGNVEGNLPLVGQEPSNIAPGQEVELEVVYAKEIQKRIDLAVRWPSGSFPSGPGQGKQKKKK